jgi:uncharacterized membrane protein YeiH
MALAMLPQVAERYLFVLPTSFDLGGVFFFALTGGLAAVRRGYDPVGLFALALISGLGGGMIRDGIFLQDGPPAMMRDWRYLAAVAVGAVAGWIVGLRIERFQRVIAVADALGLAAYGIFGVCKALAAGLSYPASILVGVINASGGGLLRDVIVREEPLVMKPGQVYVLASLIGCIGFVILVRYTDLDTEPAAWLAIALTFALRMLAIAFNWRTRPVSRPTVGP